MAIVTYKLFEAANATITLYARVDDQTNKLIGVHSENNSPYTCWFKASDPQQQSSTQELTLPAGGTFDMALSHGLNLPRQAGEIVWSDFNLAFRWPA